MNKREIPLIALAFFSIIILLANGNIEKAFAITITNITLPIIPDVIAYAPSIDRYLAFNSGDNVQVIHPTLKTIVATYALTGIDDISCDATRCYTGISGSADGNSFIIGFNPLNGAIQTNATFNFASGAYSAIDDTATGSNKLIASGSVYWLAICDNGNYVMLVANGNNPSGLIGDCAGTNFGASLTTLGMVVFDNKIAFTTDSASTNAFQIWQTAGGQVCEGATFTYGTGGAMAYSETTGFVYVATASSEVVQVRNTSTCAIASSITNAQHGLTTLLRGIQVNDEREELYIQSTTHIAVQDLNTPTSNLYTVSAGGDTGTARDKTAVSEENNQYATAFSTTFRIVDLDAIEGQDGIDGICPVGTALECVGDRSTINQITGAQNFTTVIGNLGTQLGIMNTTANTDPETNGSGLLLMLITGTFFASVVISSIAVANNKFGANIQYTEIPKEFWLFLVVGVVALSFYLNWIPDIVFYGMVVGLVGLFSFGLYTKYKGNG